MARGINKAIILGNLGADPETRVLPSGVQVTNFNVATSEQWKDKQTGNRQEKTEWHRISAFGKLAEICAQYLRKGSKVYIEGKIQTNRSEGDDGQVRYFTNIVANEMQMLDSAGGSQDAGSRPGPAEQPEQEEQTGDDFDDDVPF